MVNGPYLETMEQVVERELGRGQPPAPGPYRHPWIAAWFTRSMEPPPKRRIKTFKSMEPAASPPVDDVGPSFDVLQRRLETLIERAAGLDLGRIRFGSPFARFMRLSLGCGLELVLAHNRRHLWHVDRCLGSSPPA